MKRNKTATVTPTFTDNETEGIKIQDSAVLRALKLQQLKYLVSLIEPEIKEKDPTLWKSKMKKEDWLQIVLKEKSLCSTHVDQLTNAPERPRKKKKANQVHKNYSKHVFNQELEEEMEVALLYKDADKLWFVAKGILERLVIPERLFTSAVELNRDRYSLVEVTQVEENFGNLKCGPMNDQNLQCGLRVGWLKEKIVSLSEFQAKASGVDSYSDLNSALDSLNQTQLEESPQNSNDTQIDTEPDLIEIPPVTTNFDRMKEEMYLNRIKDLEDQVSSLQSELSVSHDTKKFLAEAHGKMLKMKRLIAKQKVLLDDICVVPEKLVNVDHLKHLTHECNLDEKKRFYRVTMTVKEYIVLESHCVTDLIKYSLFMLQSVYGFNFKEISYCSQSTYGKHEYISPDSNVLKTKIADVIKGEVEKFITSAFTKCGVSNLSAKIGRALSSFHRELREPDRMHENDKFFHLIKDGVLVMRKTGTSTSEIAYTITELSGN